MSKRLHNINVYKEKDMCVELIHIQLNLLHKSL